MPVQNNISFKSAPEEKVAQEVADIILSNRRPFNNDNLSKSNYSYISSIISKKITPSVKKAEPIPIAIVGFSMKSPNTQKTISIVADRAEYESLEHLKDITEKIDKVYPYGSDFKIFADGRIFVNTIYGSSDNKVTQYVNSNRAILKAQKAKEIKILSLDDFFDGSEEEKRKLLFGEFPSDKKEISRLIETDEFFKTYYQQMRDFYAKDIHAINPSISCKNSRVLGQQIALGVIYAANSYEKFINSLYPQPYLRLSVHSKPIHDSQEKIGIFLNKLKSNFPTPWHSAAAKIIDKDGKEHFVYEKKSVLEKAGCQFVPDIDGKGAYFIFPQDKEYDFSKSFKENIN